MEIWTEVRVDRTTVGQKYGETERQESLRQKDRETEQQKDRKTEKQKDRKTERQKDRKTERQKDRRMNTFHLFKVTL